MKKTNTIKIGGLYYAENDNFWAWGETEEIAENRLEINSKL